MHGNTPPAGDAGDATLDDVLNRAVGSHPEPSTIAPELIAQADADDATPAHQVAGAARVVFPDGFDPAIHIYPPQRTARNTWRKLRPGQKNENLPSTGNVGADVASAVTSAGAAENVCAAFFGIAPALLNRATDVDWSPTPEERTAVVDALTRYFDAHGSIDIPPGVALILAVGTYALPRAMQLERVQALYGKLLGSVTGAAAGADSAASNSRRRRRRPAPRWSRRSRSTIR
jgi:hypothetical protein